MWNNSFIVHPCILWCIVCLVLFCIFPLSFRFVVMIWKGKWPFSTTPLLLNSIRLIEFRSNGVVCASPSQGYSRSTSVLINSLVSLYNTWLKRGTVKRKVKNTTCKNTTHQNLAQAKNRIWTVHHSIIPKKKKKKKKQKME